MASLSRAAASHGGAGDGQQRPVWRAPRDVMLRQGGEAGRSWSRRSSLGAAGAHSRCLILLQLLAAGSVTNQPFQGRGCRRPGTGQAGPAAGRARAPPQCRLCPCEPLPQ